MTILKRKIEPSPSGREVVPNEGLKNVNICIYQILIINEKEVFKKTRNIMFALLTRT